MTCLSFSPDGQLLAAGGARGTVRVWQVQASPEGPPALVAAASSAVPEAGARVSAGAVRWLPAADGRVLLTGNRNNSSLQLWHAPEGAGALDWAPLQSLRFEGKDGQQVGVGGWGHQGLR